jgi:pseudoazurin
MKAKTMKLSLKLALATAAAALLVTPVAQAAEREVKEVNQGSLGLMAFEPGVLKLKVGDTLHVTAADFGHDLESIDGMIPAGAQAVKVVGPKGGEVKFTKPGIYAFKCAPHYSAGMVLLVQVGAPVNLAQVQAAAANSPPLARKRFATEFAMLK